jgi:hypothetical protein
MVDHPAVEESVLPAPGPVHELVEHHEVAGSDARLKRTGGTGPDHPANTELA